MQISVISFHRVFLVTMASLLLVACGETNFEAAKKGSALANTEILAAIESAKGEKEPWEAYKSLTERSSKALQRQCVVSEGVFTAKSRVCGEVPATAEGNKERLRYLTQALQQNDPRALVFLFAMDRHDSEYGEFASMRKAHAARLIAVAEGAKGDKQDGPLLLVAGDVAATGTDFILDGSKAVSFYARAWAGGQPQAANSAASVFYSINDYRNTYLWSLRCIAPCNRTHYLSDLQRKLSPEAAKQVQAHAASPSVIELKGDEGV